METDDGIRVYQHMVLVEPMESAWTVRWGGSESEHQSLDEAIEVAEALVIELQAGDFPHSWLAHAKAWQDQGMKVG